MKLDFNVPQECNAMSLPKVSRVYAAPRSAFGQWYYTETATLQTAIISGNSGNSQVPKLMLVGDTFQFSETYEEEAERNYRQEVQFTILPTSAANRDILEMMKVERELLIFFEDANDRIWLAGETKGMRVTRYSYSTEQNSYDVTLLAQERSQIRQVDTDYFESLINPECVEILCEADWDELCASTWDCLCAPETIWQDKIKIGSWDATTDLEASAFRYLLTPGNDEVEVFWGDGTSTVYPTGIDNDTSIQHTYPAPAIYEISVKTTDLNKLFTFSRIEIRGDVLNTNEYWQGVLDLRQFKQLETFEYNLSNPSNTEITEFLFDTNNTTNFDKITMVDASSIERLDVSKLTNLGGSFRLLRSAGGRPGMSGLQELYFPAAMNPIANNFTELIIQNAPLEISNNIDLSGLTNLGGDILFFQSINPTASAGSSITFPKPDAGANNVTGCRFSDCNAQTIDMSNFDSLGGQISGYGRTAECFNNLIFPTSLRAGTEDITSISFTRIGGGTSVNIIGSVDLSALTTINNCNIDFGRNANLTNIVFPATAGKLNRFHADNCNIGYISGIGNFSNLDGIDMNLFGNKMTAAEVNFWLRDLDISGAINGSLNISGNNAAPDTTSGGVDGVAAVASLVAKGWTVTTS